MLSISTVVRQSRAAVIVASALSFACLFSQAASASTETPIYSFGNTPDANGPTYGVVQGPDGNLYGTTPQGGSGGLGLGDGTIYQLTPPTPHHASWQEKVLFSFTGGKIGSRPAGPVVFDAAGNMYGTAITGGDLTQCKNQGCGLVYMLSAPVEGKKKRKYTVLHNFVSSDGSSPSGALTIDSAGNIYGTTMYGGGDNYCSGDAGGCGVIYKLSPPAPGKKKWKIDILYAMQHDFGAVPTGGLVFDATEGALYGTTAGGGTSLLNGVVFQLKTPRRGHGSWAYAVIHNFLGADQSDGGEPYAGLAFDSSGNLYGTTQFGGITNCGNGCGVVFKLAPSGANWTETIVHNFTGGSDGRNPIAGLTFDGAAMYGTAQSGGGSGCGIGCGTVFKMTLSPFNFSALYAFQNGNDGSVPHNATLLLGDDGLLYGTAGGGEGVVYTVVANP